MWGRLPGRSRGLQGPPGESPKTSRFEQRMRPPIFPDGFNKGPYDYTHFFSKAFRGLNPKPQKEDGLDPYLHGSQRDLVAATWTFAWPYWDNGQENGNYYSVTGIIYW